MVINVTKYDTIAVAALGGKIHVVKHDGPIMVGV